MTRFPLTGRYSSLCVLLTLFWLSGQSLPVRAEKIYSPVPLILNKEINDTLTDKDIPTGEGGFARDYTVDLDRTIRWPSISNRKILMGC